MVKPKSKKEDKNNFKKIKKTSFEILKEEIKDEMQWLRDRFLILESPQITIWRNSHAEDRYNQLKERLKSLKL